MSDPESRYELPRLSPEVVETAERLAQLGSWEWLPKSGELRWSENLYRIVGLEPGEFVPTPEYFLEHTHPDDRELAEQAASTLVQGGEIPTLDYRFVRPDGTVRHLRSATVVIDRQGDQPLRVIGTVQDLTDLRSAEQEIEAHLAHEQQAQRLDSIGDLAGGIAHDFNNLLAVIRSNSELALEGAGKSGEITADEAEFIREELNDVTDAAAHAEKLTSQLLVFSRREVTTRELIDLNEVVRGIEHLFRRSLGESVELEIQTADDLPLVMANPNQIEQILLNLAINARDAMPEGGRLTVSTALADLGREHTDGWTDLDPGQYVRLTVADEGVGMSPEIAARAFEPFFTTKGKGEGTGLGLATVYGVVKKTGGHIAVDSEEGIGTVIRIHLPPADPDAPVEEMTSPEPIEASPRNGGGSILVAEDADRVRRTVARVLRHGGYDVITASGGEEALEILRRGGPPVALLLTDVVMPGMLGSELAERARALRPGVPILFMSGYAGVDRAVDPPGGIIEKPFTTSGLLARVAEALAPAGG